MYALAPDMKSVLTTDRGLNAFITGVACVLPSDMVFKNFLLVLLQQCFTVYGGTPLKNLMLPSWVQNKTRLMKYQERGYACKKMSLDGYAHAHVCVREAEQLDGLHVEQFA